ncbi:hypothetical protein [Deinococcus detaillensis]|uniref:hypothetical protein n=1 Tax=Deinococcus detaillensis TaxID=2592048 RepID=UPI00163DE05A|nr:hypothetical protein [Deinococcus detaillensis]
MTALPVVPAGCGSRGAVTLNALCRSMDFLKPDLFGLVGGSGLLPLRRKTGAI